MTVGAVVGALASVYALAGVRRARSVLDPRVVPVRAAGRAQRAGTRVRAAIDEGRRVRHDYETRARHDYETRARDRHRARPAGRPGAGR